MDVLQNTRVALLAALLLAAIGGPAIAAEAILPCGWQSDEPPWPLRPDGEVVDIPPAPGAVRLQLQGAGGQSGVEYCGGIALSAGWVLTARHCIEGKIWRDLRVTAGTDVLQSDGKGVERHVNAAYCLKRGPGDVLATDLALLRLAAPFPAGVTAARLATFAGTAGSSLPFSGVLASWPVIYRNPDPQPVVLSAFDVFARSAPGVLIARPVIAEKSPPCSGESGSALWQETPQGPVVRGILSAVSSTVASDNAQSARDICRSGKLLANFVDIARQFAWIRETMEICEAAPDACAVRR